MNQINNQDERQQAPATTEKNGVLKTLAVIGFIGLLVVIAWVSIQLVSLAPSAVLSLASIADTVQNYDPESRSTVDFTVVNSKTIINNEEPVTVTWNTPRQTGTFAFSYACASGVALDLRPQNEGIRSLNCDTNYNIGSTNSIDISVSSEQNRFTDVLYTIDFIPDGSDVPTGSQSSSITVINASISPVAVVDTDEEPTPEEPAAEPVSDTPAQETTTTEPTPTLPAPTYVQQYVYEIPVSNPNGTTDLAVRAIGVSTLDTNNRYTNSNFLVAGQRGALQIEVKNIGTRTSTDWDYIVTLPTGVTYEADNQEPLRPNERTVLTLGFQVPDDTSGIVTWSGEISTNRDRNPINNSFQATAQIR